jgi:hypothetical protein
VAVKGAGRAPHVAVREGVVWSPVWRGGERMGRGRWKAWMAVCSVERVSAVCGKLGEETRGDPVWGGQSVMRGEASPVLDRARLLIIFSIINSYSII